MSSVTKDEGDNDDYVVITLTTMITTYTSTAVNDNTL